MSHRSIHSLAALRTGYLACLSAAALVVLVASITASPVWAGNNGGFGFQAVGGVSINPEGVLAQPTAEELKLLRDKYTKEWKEVPAGLNQPVELRKISLRAIEEAVAKAEQNVAYDLPDEIRFLAGIQRIQYVLVYPEQNDIVLAGPGEGWKIDERGNYVGVTTGRPVMRLEDLLVALRTVENARQGGITVSIDPTQEGRQRYAELRRNTKRFTPQLVAAAEKAFGLQNITITGVPDTSRMARTLAGSDFQMKRIAMKLTASPVKGLPSYLDLIKQDRAKITNMMPRWWMACNYEPLGKSADGLAWELRGQGVKVMTEDEIIGNDGSVTGTGKAGPAAQKWADLMTAKYDELSGKEPIFGELRNVMDLCVISALIAKEGLLGKAGLEIPTLTSKDSKLELVRFPAPKNVPTQCSTLKDGNETILTASGGVEITSWQVADRSLESSDAAKVRTEAAAKNPSLWWN
jgi:hypothetical protein